MTQANVDVLINEGQRVVERLCADLNIAESSWAHFEALNGETSDKREELRKALSSLGMSHKGLLAAVFRDALMALSRIVDDRSGSDSLCKIAKLLKKRNLSSALILRVEIYAPSFLKTVVADSFQDDIDAILGSILIQWDNGSPENPDFLDWRNQIKPLRDKILAHSGDMNDISILEIERVRQGLLMSAHFIYLSRKLFLGSAPPETLLPLVQHANKFWDYAQMGFIESVGRH